MSLEANVLHRDDVGGRLVDEVLIRVPGGGLCLASLVDEDLGDADGRLADLLILRTDDMGCLGRRGADGKAGHYEGYY